MQKCQACHNATRKTQLYPPELKRKRTELRAEWCWAGSLKILHSFFWFFSFWRLIPISASSLPGMPEEGEEAMETMTGIVVNGFMCWMRLLKKSWSFSAIWIAGWRVWMYVAFRAGYMHRCMKTAGLRQDEEKNSPGRNCVVCLQIHSVYFFSVGVNIHSSLLAKK